MSFLKSALKFAKEIEKLQKARAREMAKQEKATQKALKIAARSLKKTDRKSENIERHPENNEQSTMGMPIEDFKIINIRLTIDREYNWILTNEY